MIESVFTGIGGDDIAVTGLRVLIGAFFVISGYHKLFNPARHATLRQTLVACKIPFVPVFEWLVPAIEFAAGLALVVGFMTPLAAAGLLAICLVAVATDGLKRVKAMKPIDPADAIDDMLYLPESLYVLILAFFVFVGSGPFSYDAAIVNMLF